MGLGGPLKTRVFRWFICISANFVYFVNVFTVFQNNQKCITFSFLIEALSFIIPPPSICFIRFVSIIAFNQLIIIAITVKYTYYIF